MTKEMEPKIGILGLGAMGLPMALRLAEYFSVSAFDVSNERLRQAALGGVSPSGSATEAVGDVDVVLLAVRNRSQLEDALLGEEGIARSLRAGTVVIITSTVGVDALTEIVLSLEQFGIDIVDAPLSGGPQRARTGDLLIVVGGAEGPLAIAKPVLEVLASTLSVVGSRPGDGQALKTVNQLLCGVHIAAAGEALALASKLGLEPARVLPLLQAGAASSFMLGDRGPRVIEALKGEDPEVRSRLDIFVKDMGIVADAARKCSLPTPTASAAEQVFRLGLAQGLGGEDDSTMVRVAVGREGEE